ncbi:hypothetical protein B7463_g3231, partial [Scytalidium lignicola]
MSNENPFLYPNITSVSQCNINVCNIQDATVTYIPTLFGNALYAGVFGALLISQAGLLVYYRTWTYSIAMLCGCILEVIGYVSRIFMHFNVWESNPFLIYLITLTVGPVFYSAAIYVTLSRIIVHYGVENSRFATKTISITFMTSDFVSLVLQAVGGALADTASTQTDQDLGVHIMVAGLGFQVFSICVFITVATDFGLRVWKHVKINKRLSEAGGQNSRHESENGLIREFGVGQSHMKSELSFKLFLISLSLATFFILVRSAFRVAELVNGFSGSLANDEVTLMILEGAMISLATILLTVFHPGHAFKGRWSDAGWEQKPGYTRNRGKSDSVIDEEIEMA